MGVIFDMDGVLIDSNEAHFASWTQVAQRRGADFKQEKFNRTFGMKSEEIVAHYWEPAPKSKEEIAEIVEEKETIFREGVAKHVRPIEGAIAFVRYLSERGVKLAVASSAPRINVDYVLRWLGIDGLFNAVVAGTEVKRGKPEPDIFLAAAEKMGEKAENCIAIDDARSGVDAAKSSGAITVGFFSAGHSASEYENADCVVRSFDELRERLIIDANGDVEATI